MNRSLRTRLLGWLLGPLLLVVLLGAIIAYFIARHAATMALDKALVDPVIVLTDHLQHIDGRERLVMVKEALDVLLIDSEDRMFYRVSYPDGSTIAGSADIPLRPASFPQSQIVFYDDRYRGSDVRIAMLTTQSHGEKVVVAVAETLVKRNQLLREIMLGALLPEILVAVGMVVLVVLGVKRALAPLSQLQSEISARTQPNPAPILEDDRPAEVLPLIRALNVLLERVKEMLAAQQRFIANAAHQLRTPIAGMQAQLELVLRQSQTNEQRQTFQMLLGAAVKSGRLVNQLLTLAQVDSKSQYAVKLSEIDLKRLIETKAQEWDRRAREKNIDLGFDLQPAVVMGDEFLISEMLTNIVENAIAYTPDEGSVTLRCAAQGSTVLLQVEDNGIGIPENQRDIVFERFYRVGATPGQGSGLGLAIVAEIAQLHHASLEVSSPASGRGTVMGVRFELAGMVGPQ